MISSASVITGFRMKHSKAFFYSFELSNGVIRQTVEDSAFLRWKGFEDRVIVEEIEGSLTQTCRVIGYIPLSERSIDECRLLRYTRRFPEVCSL